MMALIRNFLVRLTQRQNKYVKNRAKTPSQLERSNYARNRKKPQWVVEKVIYLKAIMPDTGCGTIADIFNRIHHDKNESISKTYVFEKLKTNAYRVKPKSRDIKLEGPRHPQ